MPTTVFANMMGISHMGSGGKSLVFPDVCKTPTPAGPVPIPYPNLAESSTLQSGSSTVTIEGQPAAIKGCNYSLSSGDEAGSAGGVASSKIKGKAEFILYSFDVKIDGQNACRMGDMMTHNDKNAVG
ncbi:MAG TPA: DUF4150 domain-containing protein [Polyangia bacterium]|nr:DUF4150 domain-containing protein [Polyangia bacterium]